MTEEENFNIIINIIKKEYLRVLKNAEIHVKQQKTNVEVFYDKVNKTFCYSSSRINSPNSLILLKKINKEG